MATNSEKREESLACILRAARSLILKRGFNAVSINDILIEADVTKGRFFHYFSSKEDLYSRLLTESLASREFLDLRSVLEEVATLPPTVQLLTLIERSIQWHEASLPETMRLCVFATFFFGADSPQLDAIQTRLKNNIGIIANLIVASQRRGELPDTLSAERLALCIPSLVTGGNLVGPLYGKDDLVVENLRQLKKLIEALYTPASQDPNEPKQ